MDLQKANRLIKHTWLIGIFIASIIVFEFIASITGYLNTETNYIITELPVVLGLSFGLYKKNFTCFIAFFCFILTFTINFILNNPQHWFNLLLVAFLYVAFRGIQGSHYYHTMIDKHKSQLEKAQTKINCAWFSGIVWLILNILSPSSNHVLNLLILGVLTFGIYKKSIACIILLMIQSISLKPAASDFAAIHILAIFGIFWIYGIEGVLSYHKIIKAQQSLPK